MNSDIVEFQLFVYSQSDDKSQTLRYRLRAEDSRRKTETTKFAPQRLADGSFRYFRAIFGNLDRWSRTGEEEERRDERRLAGIGAQLFDELLPESLRRRLQEIVENSGGRAPSLWIVSNETVIPWELLKMPQGPYLAEAFALTRWLGESESAPEASTCLPLRRMALIVDPSLPASEKESREVQTLAAEDGRVESLLPEVEDLVVRMPEFDGLHLIVHGSAGGEQADLWGLHVGRKESLYPADLRETQLPEKPLIFANACHSGAGGSGLVGSGGLAKAFLEAGAGAFVGAHWTIADDRAQRFSQTFYAAFFAGTTLGEAVRRARMVVRKEYPGDPTWAAYTVYAHPAARCLAPLEPPTPPRRRLPSIRQIFAAALAALLVLGAVVAFLPVPTRVEVDLLVDRVDFVVGEEVGLLPLLSFQALELREFDRIESQGIEIRDDSGIPISKESEVVVLEAGFDSMSGVFRTSLDRAASGRLDRIPLVPGARVEIMTTPREYPSKIDVTFRVDPLEHLVWTVVGESEIHAEHIHFGADVSELQTLVGRGGSKKRFGYAFAVQGMVCTATVPFAQEALLEDDLPIAAIALPVLQGSGVLRYPERPTASEVSLQREDHVALKMSSGFRIQNLDIDPATGYLRLRLDGVASEVRTGTKEAMRDRRLTLLDQLKSAISNHELMQDEVRAAAPRVYSIGEKPGKGNYCCTSCEDWEADLDEDDDSLPPCGTCGKGQRVSYIKC